MVNDDFLKKFRKVIEQPLSPDQINPRLEGQSESQGMLKKLKKKLRKIFRRATN